MNKNIDRIRDKTPKRRKMHKNIDELRNKEEYRKLQLHKYEHTETRRHYEEVRNKSRYLKKLYSTLTTDTGKDFCRQVTREIKQKYSKFIVKSSSLLRNRTDGQFLCHVCFKDMKKTKFRKEVM